MKKFVIYSIVFLAFITPVFADTVIQQGSAQDSVHVSTNIQGSGSVSTHIESTVNSQTKTFDSTTPGSYTIENSVPGSSPTKHSDKSQNTRTPTSAPTIISTITPQPTLSAKHIVTTQANLLGKIQKSVHTFFQKILSFFHL